MVSGAGTSTSAPYFHAAEPAGVTSAQEEVGVALLHYQWPLQSVAEAAGGMEEVAAESSWKPMQVGS